MAAPPAGAERQAPAEPDPRAQAAAYLDLWERHLGVAAAQGAAPFGLRRKDPP